MSFLESAIKRFEEYKGLAEKAMSQVDDTQLLHDTSTEGGNSLVVIVKHMSGNMLSRWTNFLTEDGEKPWRQREEEFIHAGLTRAQLMERWETGWACMFDTLRSLNEEDLSQTVHIRSEPLTAMDAIVRQLMHYAYHVGQIVLICKDMRAGTWQSLSIPRGGTAAFNASMQAKSTH